MVGYSCRLGIDKIKSGCQFCGLLDGSDYMSNKFKQMNISLEKGNILPDKKAEKKGDYTTKTQLSWRLNLLYHPCVTVTPENTHDILRIIRV